jgi:hypothetical protein
MGVALHYAHDKTEELVDLALIKGSFECDFRELKVSP